MIAFLVVSHRNPGQVLRLVRALREAEDSHVLVHHDQRREPLDAADVDDAGGQLVGYGLSVEWGNVAYTEMLLRALAELSEQHDPDWVAVVSGQDYPLRPLRDFEAHLRRSLHQALLGDHWELDLDAEPPPPHREFYLRYRYRHYAPPRPVAAAIARVLGPRGYVRELPMGLGMRLGIKPWRHPFGPGLRCYVSSDWLTLEREAVRAVLDFSRTRTAVMRHYRRTIIPSESLFATVLFNDPSISVGPAPRLLGFEDGSPHPHTFRSRDVDRLLGSGLHFARKFDDTVDARALDLLDKARNPGI
jgi:hypothetical protein